MSTDVEVERRRIEMPVETALEDEWGKGIAEQRSGDQSKPFVGDALVHLHDHLLGGINNTRQIGRDDETTSQMLDNQGIEQELKRLLRVIRALYRLREVRRARLDLEALELANPSEKPN